jgi:hypothetical protein
VPDLSGEPAFLTPSSGELAPSREAIGRRAALGAEALLRMEPLWKQRAQPMTRVSPSYVRQDQRISAQFVAAACHWLGRHYMVRPQVDLHLRLNKGRFSRLGRRLDKSPKDTRPATTPNGVSHATSHRQRAPAQPDHQPRRKPDPLSQSRPGYLCPFTTSNPNAGSVQQPPFCRYFLMGGTGLGPVTPSLSIRTYALRLVAPNAAYCRFFPRK